MVGILGLRIPDALEDRYRLSDAIPAQERPVVFIGPFEHHSNELPWRESIADVVGIPQDTDGHIDVQVLKTELLRHAGRPLKIGSFSAASNVTGIVSDTHRISALLHAHGAMSFWDFAAAAPYVDIEMYGPKGSELLVYKDAIFLSPHKFIGGPSTPGVLVVRRELLHNRVPDVPGGGTVAYVNPTEHRYLDDPAQREEGGTPAIVESIRAGLVFQLKQAVGVGVIRAHEDHFLRRAITAWQQEPNIEILGNLDAERLSIVSFVVRGSQGRYLHHNFVVSLLNDLCGIQARGGCSCAGPYGHRLLGIDLDQSRAFEREIAHGCEGIKPGWVRINFNYFISAPVFHYLVEAVRLIARDGARLLPDYRFDPATGLWRHRLGPVEPPLRLRQIYYDADGDMQYPHQRDRAPESERTLAGLHRIFTIAVAVASCTVPTLRDEHRAMRCRSRMEVDVVMTNYENGSGASMWGLGLVIIVGVVLIGLAVWAVVAGTNRGNRGFATQGISPAETGGRSRTRQVLDDRYARGELDSKEYTERLHTLGL